MSQHHIVTPKTYASVLGGLLFLMVATIVAAKIHIGPWQNLLVALAIATCKMSLIIAFFMHVKYSSKLTQVFAIAGFVWLIIFFVLLFDDYAAREYGGETPFLKGSPYALEAPES